MHVGNLLDEAGEGDAHLHHGLAGLKQELSNTGIFTIYVRWLSLTSKAEVIKTNITYSYSRRLSEA
jgi:hypothetical protein